MQHIDHRRDGRDLMLGMDIGQDRNTELLPDVAENLQPLVHAQSTKGLAGTAIGLVVGGFVDEVQAQPATEFAQLARRIEGHLARFDDAGTCNQKERPIKPDFKPAEFHCLAFCFSSAACT